MRLSLCIATFNEEKNIHYPLDSVIDIVDEVVVVDGGSTDKTVEIAKSYGKKVKIIKSDNPLMFHKNKQKAIDEARGDWILQLDADEELSNELKEEILNLLKIKNSKFKSQNKDEGLEINKEKENIVAYWIPRKNWFLTKFLEKGGQYPDYTIRLYKKGYVRFPCKDVHENVEIIQNSKSKIQNDNLKCKIGYLKNPILHYADPDFSRYLMRWDRYTTIEVEKLATFSSKKLNFFNYFFWKPVITFVSMYIRHKGFMDGFPGFVFALFSSIRFWVIYVKWWSIKLKNS